MIFSYNGSTRVCLILFVNYNQTSPSNQILKCDKQNNNAYDKSSENPIIIFIFKKNYFIYIDSVTKDAKSIFFLGH